MIRKKQNWYTNLKIKIWRKKKYMENIENIEGSQDPSGYDQASPDASYPYDSQQQGYEEGEDHEEMEDGENYEEMGKELKKKKL